MSLEEQFQKSIIELKKLNVVTDKTRKTLTMVNIINTVTLIVIAYMIMRGLI